MASTKTNQVQTPIDHRETFVSLQKSFAEGAQSVKEKLQTLYELQAADTDIDKLVQLRGELPEEVAELEHEVEALKSKHAHIEDVIEGYNKTIENCKQEIVSIDADIAEKNINEARYSIEDKKRDLELLEGKIAIREEDLAAKKAELEQIVESTAKEEAVLKERRDACAAKIDERTMSAYERIRASVHNRLAVVTVYNGDSCGGCFNTVTPQRLIDIASGKKLVICEHCGRIIVANE